VACLQIFNNRIYLEKYEKPENNFKVMSFDFERLLINTEY
jgi:hypothetical protein